MTAFPSTTPTKANLDASTDSPAAARSELVTLIDLVTQMIQSFADPSGICDLDATGKVPAARLPSGASSGVDADLLDGQHGSFYRNIGNMNAGTLAGARFNDTSHGNRSGGSLHANATTSVAGFMSAADKTTLNSAHQSVANLGSGAGILIESGTQVQAKSLAVSLTFGGDETSFTITETATTITLALYLTQVTGGN